MQRNEGVAMQTVLIADDEAKVCQLIQGLVPWETLGLSVVGTVHDGLSALERMRTNMPDILITDIRMPGLDGIQLIQQAKEIHPALRCVIISGYRHFDYAHNAIKFGVQDYLLKPLQKEELIRTLQKLMAQPGQEKLAEHDTSPLLEAFCADSISGKLSAAEATQEYLRARYRLALPADLRYCALLAKADVEGVAVEDTARRIAAQKLADGCRAAFAPLTNRLYVALTDVGVAVLLEVAEDRLEALHDALYQLRDRMEMMRDLFPTLRVSIGVGDAADTAAGVAESFRQAAHALDQRLTRAEGAVILYSPAPCRTFVLRDLLGPDLLHQLSAALQGMRVNTYRTLLQTCFHRLRRAVGEDLPALRTLLRELVRYHCEQLPVSITLQEMEGMMAACSEGWHAAISLAQVERENAQRLAAHLASVDEALQQIEQLPVRKAKAYIREHYREPLTLEMVSDVAGFNPAYFSSLFKKETGERFLEYLAAVRIKAAKQLLTDSDLPVTAIVEETGYGDYKYFCKQFKKESGLSPQEYRKLYS